MGMNLPTLFLQVLMRWCWNRRSINGIAGKIGGVVFKSLALDVPWPKTAGGSARPQYLVLHNPLFLSHQVISVEGVL